MPETKQWVRLSWPKKKESSYLYLFLSPDPSYCCTANFLARCYVVAGVEIRWLTHFSGNSNRFRIFLNFLKSLRESTWSIVKLDPPHFGFLSTTISHLCHPSHHVSYFFFFTQWRAPVDMCTAKSLVFRLYPKLRSTLSANFLCTSSAIS